MLKTEITSILLSDRTPTCDVYHKFIHSVNTCMRKSGYTRAGVADRMNSALEVMEVEVDESKLNKWFAPSQPQYMPVQFLPALCWAVKSIEPANILLEPLLFKAVDHRAQILQRHSEMELEKREIERQQAQLIDSITFPTN